MRISARTEFGSTVTALRSADEARSIVGPPPPLNWARPERYVRFWGCPVRPPAFAQVPKSTPSGSSGAAADPTRRPNNGSRRGEFAYPKLDESLTRTQSASPSHDGHQSSRASHCGSPKPAAVVRELSLDRSAALASSKSRMRTPQPRSRSRVVAADATPGSRPEDVHSGSLLQLNIRSQATGSRPCLPTKTYAATAFSDVATTAESALSPLQALPRVHATIKGTAARLRTPDGTPPW